MKAIIISTCIILVIIPGDFALGQEVQTNPAQDSTVGDSLVVGEVVEIPDAIVPEVDSADSVMLARFDELASRIDSLEDVNRRIAAVAARRLTREVFIDSFRSYVFYSCIVNPRKVSIQLHNRGERKFIHNFASLSSLAQQQGKTLVFAMNAGMFLRNRLAKGLLVANGKQQQKLDTATVGYGNFYMQPNGVFALDSTGRAYVIPTWKYAALADTNKIVCATQSGPMMLINGKINPKFNDGSPNRHVRNAVGITPENEVVFAISQQPVTFFELSSFMIQQGCTDALYLDGAISQVYMPEIGIDNIEAGNYLGPIIVIME